MSMRVIEPSFASDEAQPTPYGEGQHLSLIKQRLIGVSRWATEVRATVERLGIRCGHFAELPSLVA